MGQDSSSDIEILTRNSERDTPGESILSYYAEHGPLTRPGSHAGLVDDLPKRADALAGIIQQLCIYDMVAEDFYKVKIPEERAGEIHIRPAAAMIGRILDLDPAPLSEPRPPERRLVSRCRNFVQLMVAILRHHGVPARSRCGFGAYFNPPNFEDHWVAEYWAEAERRWKRVDVQFDEQWRRNLHIEHDVLDVPHDQFLIAADAWRQCRSGKMGPDRFGIEFVKLRGQWFIAGSLIRDLAALNKMEMLPWDVWGTMPEPNEKLDEDQLAFFDRLAAITGQPDEHRDEIQACYRTEGLRVPESVFNSLLRHQDEVETA